MLICHDWKLVFLHVPKCAGTAIRQALEEQARPGTTTSFWDFEYNRRLRRHVDLAHLPLMDLRHYSEWQFLDDYHTLASIRHPYARLASACREFYRQKSRATEVQMRKFPPSSEQLLDYLRALPAAVESRDLRYAHAFPLVWFTHYGSKPMVDTLLECNDLKRDLAKLSDSGVLSTAVVDGVLAAFSRSPRRKSADLMPLEADPNLQAIANFLYWEDFETFGFAREQTDARDESLRRNLDRCLGTTESHEIPYISQAPRWTQTE